MATTSRCRRHACLLLLLLFSLRASAILREQPRPYNMYVVIYMMLSRMSRMMSRLFMLHVQRAMRYIRLPIRHDDAADASCHDAPPFELRLIDVSPMAFITIR